MKWVMVSNHFRRALRDWRGPWFESFAIRLQGESPVQLLLIMMQYISSCYRSSVIARAHSSSNSSNGDSKSSCGGNKLCGVSKGVVGRMLKARVAAKSHKNVWAEVSLVIKSAKLLLRPGLITIIMILIMITSIISKANHISRKWERRRKLHKKQQQIWRALSLVSLNFYNIIKGQLTNKVLFLCRWFSANDEHAKS